MNSPSRLRSFALVSALALSPLLFTACDDDEYAGPPPGYGQMGGAPGGYGMSEKEQLYFGRGLDAGRRDKALLRSYNPARYRDDYTSTYERVYKAGYEEGYGSAMGPSTDMNPTQRSVYMRGYDAGRRDYANARSSNYKRHEGDYPHVVEPYFALGYEEGFRGAPPR